VAGGCVGGNSGVLGNTSEDLLHEHVCAWDLARVLEGNACVCAVVDGVVGVGAVCRVLVADRGLVVEKKLLDVVPRPSRVALNVDAPEEVARSGLWRAFESEHGVVVALCVLVEEDGPRRCGGQSGEDKANGAGEHRARDAET